MNGDNILVSKNVDLDNEGYRRVDIPVKNFKYKKFDRIYIKSDNEKVMQWDDISITEKSNIKRPFNDEDYVKSFYKDYKLVKGSKDYTDYGNGIKFTKDMTEISKHIPKYRIKCTGEHNFDVTQSSYAPGSDKSLEINFLDFNAGEGLNMDDHITIYAINDNGLEIKILESKVKDLE